MAVKAGEWGGDGGVNPWKFILDDDNKITSITVRYDTCCVYSIKFTYTDKDRVEHFAKYGAEGGVEKTIYLANGEHLCGFGGTYGVPSGLHSDIRIVITSLSFQGSKISDETFGTPQGTHFSLPLAEGKFAGFFGNFENCLDSIGAILSPQN